MGRPVTTIAAPDALMPTPHLHGLTFDITDLPASRCDCERAAGTVMEVHWLIGDYHAATMGRDALENGPDWVLDTDTVRPGSEHGDSTRCCAWCHPQVLEQAISEALDDSLDVRVCRVWIALSGAQVAA
jgi:hypothetical protein